MGDERNILQGEEVRKTLKIKFLTNNFLPKDDVGISTARAQYFIRFGGKNRS